MIAAHKIHPILAASLLFMLTGAAAQDVQPEHGTGRIARSAVESREFMVATANPEATRIGYQVLKSGGNAIDAAVAVQMMLNLVEPQSSGIGGGAFLLYWDAKAGKLITLDGRETAPMAATENYFLNADGTPQKFFQAVLGGRSVGVPGTLKLLRTAHDLYGSLPWRRLLAPTIEKSEAGFVISPRLAKSIARAKAFGLDRFDATRTYFFNADGSPKAAGTVLKNAEFAATLREIAEHGVGIFYHGEIGRRIVDTVTGAPVNPGLMQRSDLANYRVIFRDPVCVPYRSYEICGMGPPTSGGLTVGQIMAMLGHFNIPDMGFGADAVHLFTAASKRAYADRALYMADADFVRVPVKGLLDPAYLTLRAQGIDRDRAGDKATAGNPPWKDAALRAPHDGPDRPGTSHFVIVDKQGNAVSMTTTIETGFGSRLMVGGFLLNNELTDFSFRPKRDGRPVANRIDGDKRPRSSMAPTIVFKNGRPYLLVGSPGGSRIIAYVAKTLMAILDWKMDPQSAIDLPHFVNRNGATDLEQDTAAAGLQPDLEARGHKVTVRDLNSGLHAIVIEDGRLVGGADSRREGLVMGD